MRHPGLRLSEVINKSNRGKPDIVVLNIMISVGIWGSVSVQPSYNSVALEILTETGRVRGLAHNQVFTYKGRPIKGIRTAFLIACRKAGIEDFRFHDLRHTFNTNMRKAGVDQSVIMKLTGHKTAAMFHRYNTVDTADAREAYRKLDAFLGQEQSEGSSGNLGSGGKRVLP